LILSGTTDASNSDPDAEVFTVEINPQTGEYQVTTLDIDMAVDSITEFNLQNLGSLGIRGGNGAYFTVGTGTEGDSDDILITPVVPNGTVNTSADDLAMSSQWIDSNEGLRFDFVSDINLDGTYDGESRTLTGVSIGLADVSPTGGGDPLANVLLALYDDEGNIVDSETKFNNTVTSIRFYTLVGDAVTEVVIGSDPGADYSFAEAQSAGYLSFATDYDTSEYSGKTLVTEDLTSGFVIHGVMENTSVAVTANTGFNSVEAVNYEGYDFAINSIEGAYLSTEPVDFDVTFEAFDSDGDISAGSFNVLLNPYVEGTEGPDILGGGSGDDMIRGLAGDDMLEGMEGEDILIGGEGDDILIGGPGADSFEWQAGDEGEAGAPAIDQVRDFHLGEDALDLSGQLGGETDIGTLLTDYIDLNVDHSGEVPRVTLNIDTSGGGDFANADQVIDINIVGGTLGDSDQAILDSLLNPGNYDEPDTVI
jgi:Ca2+-binding RTX toxin-like protein